ncbi:hypothetical protein R5W24_002755 [Gemmata sp. JC717]|uniref:hypothetical protein n=1 Tax=Gemmata algarum TaxID=2975278 RepID=UPI0021BAEF28|nr:hypothetical protein [Gemmata algarum]MDY3553651.1 hypothetical protein [Gemmata algarum]
MPGFLISFAFGKHPNGQGLNVKTVLDDPPVDLLNEDRIQAKGIDAKYLEPEKGKKLLDLSALVPIHQLFNGPFGFAYAARLN